MLQRYIHALADLSVNIKTYQHGISGVIARDTPITSDCAKKCQQAFLAPLPGTPPFLVIALRNVNKRFWRRCWGMVAILPSNLVRPRIFSKQKKTFSFSLVLPSSLLPIQVSYLFAFLISTSTPTTLGRLSLYTPSALLDESLEPSSLDLVPHLATRFTLTPYRSNRVK